MCRPPSAADEAACARRIVTNLATRAFRRPASPADVDLLMEFYAGGPRRTADFDDGIEMALARMLASPKFIYRIEDRAGQRRSRARPYRISDLDLASRLSFFLWSSGPDDELLDARAARAG